MLESYITPMLMSYISRYVKNLKPSDLQVSFWGGDAVLRNLELRLDVLERELSYPLEIKSGHVRELVLHIPWNAILSKPVEAVIKDVEFVVKLKDVRNLPTSQPSSSHPQTTSSTSDVSKESVEQAPGYLQGYSSRILNNLTFHIQNIVVKVIEEECDMVMSFNIRAIKFHIVDENWEPNYVYTDYLQGDYSLHKVMEVEDMVVNLQAIENSSIHKEAPQEPFVRKCSFSCRTWSLYRGTKLLRSAVNILFDKVEFSADEKQFSLFLHFLDWLLAMYYSSKKLKGRDDQTVQAESNTKASDLVSPDAQAGPPDAATLSYEEVLLTTSVAGVESPPSGAEGGGWGSWMWSFVGSTEEDSSEARTEEKGVAETLSPESSSFSIMAKSISVNLKVAHHGLVPVFYSQKYFSTPVLRVHFQGCMVKVDSVPSTQLFAMSLGMMAVQASISGTCPCVQKLPSTWKANTDIHERVPIFSLGAVDTCDTDLVLTGSLFDPAPPPEEMPPVAEELLRQREEFKAVWFTYEYYDIGPTHSVEVCNEVLTVGEVDLLLSPDVLHRAQHFRRAYGESVEACPLFSDGMVVIGDPKAETIMKIKLAGGKALITPNAHHLPLSTSDQKKSKSPKQLASIPHSSLPAICITLGQSSLSITSAMYSGNASKDVPQRHQMRAELCQLELSILDIRGFPPEKLSEQEKILSLPKWEIYQHSKTYGEGEGDSLYLQLDLEEISCMLSLEQMAKMFFIYASWSQQALSTFTSMKFSPPPVPGHLGHLQVLVRDSTLTKSASGEFTLLSSVLSSCNLVIVRESQMGRLCHAVPVLFGPLGTEHWSTVEAFCEPPSQLASHALHERLVEFFTASPSEGHSGEKFSTFQLTVSGLGVCLDPVVLEFLKHIPLDMLTAIQAQPRSPERAATREPDAYLSGPQSARINQQISVQSVDGANMERSSSAGDVPETGSFVGSLKSYATKVDIKPILLVLPSTSMNEGLHSVILPEFPVLPALAESLAHGSTEAIVVSLPRITLQSAKSHVLDEPVPRDSSVSTLPWDCTLHHGSVMVLHGGSVRYLLEPFTVQTTLAMQQEGTGITIHTETLALSLSQQLGSLVSRSVSTIMEAFSPLLSPPHPEEDEDSGIASNPILTPNPAPSLRSSPAHSTATLTTLPAPSDLSTTSSSLIIHGFSTLWIQGIVSKLTIALYARLPNLAHQHTASDKTTSKKEDRSVSAVSSTGSYSTPLTSPCGGEGETENTSQTDTNVGESVVAKLIFEVDGISLQLDVQEKCTDTILKVAAVETSLFKEEGCTWSPYLPSERILTSKGSALPEKLSRLLLRSSPSAAQLQMPAQNPSISSTFRNFITLEVKTPQSLPHKPTKIQLSVQSFEVVAWLPVFSLVSSALSSVAVQTKSKGPDKLVLKPEPSEVGAWPSIEATVECFRVVLSSPDYSSLLLCNVGGVALSTSLDYPTTDVRHIVSASAYRRLSLLSSERKQPPLPAYQVDGYAVSLWGVRRGGVDLEESTEVLLYAGNTDFRVIYTPALHWRPADIGPSFAPSVRPKPAILACGHYVEVNFRSDVHLMLGPEQVDCILNIINSNTPQGAPPSPEPHPPPSPEPHLPPSPPPQTTPLKALVSGTTVALTLVTNCTEEASGLDTASESSDFVFPTLHGLEATIVPLAQIQLFSPVCGVQCGSSGWKYQASCFNMAVSYTHDVGSCGYSDLVDAQMASSLLSHPLLETRKGRPSDSNEIPPSVLSLSWDTSLNKAPVLTVDISRPVKLTVTYPLVMKVKEYISTILEVTACHSSSPGVQKDRGSREERMTEDWGERENRRAAQLKLSSTQVVVEFQLSSLAQETSSVAEMESYVSLEGEVARPTDSVTREGLVLVWDHMTLAYPNVFGHMTTQPTTITGDIHMTGLQLLVVTDCRTSPVVLPTQLNCFIFQHIPTSPLDLPYVTINLSCGLLRMVCSRRAVDLASKTLQSVREATFSEVGGTREGGSGAPSKEEEKEEEEEEEGEKEGEEEEEGEKEGEKEGEGEGVGNELQKERREPEEIEEEEVVQFTDDLRTGDFSYVTDSEALPGYSPSPGEIFFSLGSQDNVTSMSWHYREPRAVTRLSILPVPFNFTSEEDAPIDIKVGCTLDYWDEDCGIFSVLEEFCLSETTPTEVTVSRAVGARKWRIAIVEVEWVDDEEGELFVSRAKVVDREGSPVPISSVLSPVSLAGCTRVDSYFSPKFIPFSDLSVTCHNVQATLEHTPQVSGLFKDYAAMSLLDSPQELLRVNVQNLTCHSKKMRNADTIIQIDGRPSVDFVDFCDLTWRTALYPTHLNARVETRAKQLDQQSHVVKPPGSELAVTLKCSPAVLRVSQGLLHTMTLALHSWGRGEEGKGEGGGVEGEAMPVILNHFILCNDTMQDLHFGQVSTDEVVLLRSQCCVGYSWRNHKVAPQKLHLCLVTEGVWRWTRPFSISEESAQSVEIFIGRHTALLNVCVTNIGGLQKQVTFSGSWQFLSSLPFPLHLSLVATQDGGDVAYSPSKAPFLLSPDSSLASLVAPESQLAGVRVKSAHSSHWSKVYPLHSATNDWNKPQLLTEVEYSSGQMVNLWYNINPIHTSKHETLGSKITFSPLFAICNHLPFDLTMVSTATSADCLTHPMPECVVKGEGHRVAMCGLAADTWYHLKFKQSGGEGALSEPSVSISTYLLVQLPFSTAEDQLWPYADGADAFEEEEASASTRVTLFLANGSCCSLCARLERNLTNTLTLHLQPDVLVVNHCPIPIQVLELLRGEGVAEEGGRDRELVSQLDPNAVGIIAQNKFFLRIEWEGKPLSSQAISLPEKGKKSQESQNVIFSKTEENDTSMNVIGDMTLIWRYKGAMVVISIVPTYIFHNNSPYDLCVATCLFHLNVHEVLQPHIIELVASQVTKPLLFWQAGAPHDYREVDQALVLRTVDEKRLWSLPLSPNFVRHSFALPTGNPNKSSLPAVMTMHESANNVYLVVAEDPVPRFLVQNLTRQRMEAVEVGTKGIQGYPQVIPPTHQVVYEPPTFAKQYPVVFDQELARSKEKELQRNMKLVSMKFRLCQTEEEGEEGGDKEEEREWSQPFCLASDSDRILSIPRGESVLVSTHKQGSTLYLSLLPTGEAAPLCPIPAAASSSIGGSSGGGRMGVSMDLRLTQLVICLDDEVMGNAQTIHEVLQVIADGSNLQYNSLSREGTSLVFTIDSLHVNNMTEGEAGDFAVTMIPREMHMRRASLIETEPTPLVQLSIHYDPHSSSLIEKLQISLHPLTIQLEDGLLDRLKAVFQSYGLPGVLMTKTENLESGRFSSIPHAVLKESERDVSPLIIKKLVIDPSAIYLNARISFKVLLSCNDSPFHFSRYQLENVYSNWTEVSQTIASRYIMSTITHIGWLLGSLELIGSPGTFIQNVGRGLRDLVTLPYEGLTRSPGWFLVGIGHGTMSFVHHLSSGALRSVTSMASSISRNMERLSMDPHHISYQAQQRQEKPVTHFTVGLVSGASSFGLSLMSAVAGIVEQPMQSFHQMQGPTSPTGTARSILTGVGKGLLGAVAKPVGGAMELVSQTGQGIMHGTGLARRLRHKEVELQCYTGNIPRVTLCPSSTGCAIKLGRENPLLLSTPAKLVSKTGSEHLATIFVTSDKMYILDSDTNTLQQNFAISDYSLEERTTNKATNMLEEVEIHIIAKSPRQDTPKFRQVEYFLQLSKAQEESEDMELVLPLMEHTPPGPACEESHGEEPETRNSVEFLVEAHHAAQLLSLVHSLSQLAEQPDAAFYIHRTQKSESFFTAKSSF